MVMFLLFAGYITSINKARKVIIIGRNINSGHVPVTGGKMRRIVREALPGGGSGQAEGLFRPARGIQACMGLGGQG